MKNGIARSSPSQKHSMYVTRQQLDHAHNIADIYKFMLEAFLSAPSDLKYAHPGMEGLSDDIGTSYKRCLPELCQRYARIMQDVWHNHAMLEF